MLNQTVWWQRIEGAMALCVAALVFRHLNGSWLVFAILFFVPDASMLGYLAGPKRGAAIYNVFHSYAIPLVASALGVALGNGPLQFVTLIWTAHIGFDRLLGYGLKLPTGFGDTHLGTLKGARRA